VRDDLFVAAVNGHALTWLQTPVLRAPSLLTQCESSMIHIMKTATIRELRTSFPRLKQVIAAEGELIVTDRGRPAYVLRSYVHRRPAKRSATDYFARLTSRQRRPLSAAASKALDDANRGDR
jgi:antitoxin (DNA-binding transcriptional repressor) of toxin-antitoxin stability system